ncbi:glycoside hydrolase family 3 protein [Poronia punctata]|nr:glycoside hydrolase family 3 protein [Poronia punctata]
MYFRASLSASVCALLAIPSLAAVPSGVTNKELQILAGAHVIYSWPSTVSAPDELVNLIRNGVVGGLILFGENVGTGTADVLASLQSDYSASPAGSVFKKYLGADGPLFINTDQEGGQVRRIKTAGPIESAKDTGSSAHPAVRGKQAGIDAAAALSGANMNGNLAPVLGVYRHAGDFLDYYERSYGNTSAAVSLAATAFIKAQQAAGIPATAKHFPGLGAALHSQNTDLTPVTLDLSLNEIRTVDEAPYVKAIAAGVELVMPSWAIYPALDSVPAGLSRKWVTNELRTRLGFKGVVITDALEAGSLTRFGDTAALAVKAAGAGVDMLLASGRNVTQGVVTRKAVVEALQSGTLDWDEFIASSKRIIGLRKGL